MTELTKARESIRYLLYHRDYNMWLHESSGCTSKINEAARYSEDDAVKRCLANNSHVFMMAAPESIKTLCDELDNRWIPVSERLPEYGVGVFVYSNYTYVGFYSDDGYWRNDKEDIVYHAPDYWQAIILPESPHD